MPSSHNGQPLRIRVGGQGYKSSSALTCNLSTAGFNGLDTGSLAANTLYYVYACVSSNTLGLVASLSGPSTGPTGFTQNRYVGKFRTQSGSANVAKMAIVNAAIGNGDELPVQGVSEWVSYTPVITDSSGTNILTGTTVTYAYYRQVGSDMEVRYAVTQNSAGTAGSGIYRFYLPDNTFSATTYTADSNKIYVINDTNLATRVGEAKANAVTPGINDGFMTCVNTAYMNMSLGNQTNAFTEVGSSFTPGNTALQYSFNARIPIAEWANLFS
jgi:hypothetical protein